mmetsp:Transcript_36559/g.114185  ORF Transcript_36559/g.114185 Transcript_36559/m.114185 type:complete len:200 (+) Transcript_36559:1680-2279(+)
MRGRRRTRLTMSSSGAQLTPARVQQDVDGARRERGEEHRRSRLPPLPSPCLLPSRGPSLLLPAASPSLTSPWPRHPKGRRRTCRPAPPPRTRPSPGVMPLTRLLLLKPAPKSSASPASRRRKRRRGTPGRAGGSRPLGPRGSTVSTWSLLPCRRSSGGKHGSRKKEKLSLSSVPFTASKRCMFREEILLKVSSSGRTGG